MAREVINAIVCGVAVAALLAALIVVGSRNLIHFDTKLIAYASATLVSVFGITYRYTMWLQRPPTALYWRRCWQVFLRPRSLARNLARGAARMTSEIAFNRFIFRRHHTRGLTHLLLMWGCLSAFAITFPLVFGWIHFETLPEDLDWYRTYVFGFPTFAFPIHSLFGFLVFHGLVGSSILVIAGVMLAMRRRMRRHGAAALQQFAKDFLPLILFFAMSATGLMLTVSYTWMKGRAYDLLAILHAITVIFTLLWLPFGKFFHIFQRPAQLGVSFYKDAGSDEEPARCRRCGEAYASRMQVEDLIEVERRLGFSYDLETEAEHYQWICPRCRRVMTALAQGRLWYNQSQPGDLPLYSYVHSTRSTRPDPRTLRPTPGIQSGVADGDRHRA